MPGALVTVITPAYDVERFVGGAVRSVLSQSHRELEHLVVDDGSDDGTAAVAAAAAAGDPRFRLLRQENKGSSAARNTGLQAARGRYVAFLDADDEWSPHFLATSLRSLERAGRRTAATYAQTRVMLEGGQVVGLRLQKAGPLDLDQMLSAHNPTHNGSSLLLHADVFEQVGHFDESLRSAVDLDMWLRIMAESDRPLFCGLRRHLVSMRLMRTGSISADRGARYAALDGLLHKYAPRMTRLHPGLAYVKPAIFAFRDGRDDYGRVWANLAWQAGRAAVLRHPHGAALCAWSRTGTGGRAMLRVARDASRSTAYRCLSRTSEVVRRR